MERGALPLEKSYIRACVLTVYQTLTYPRVISHSFIVIAHVTLDGPDPDRFDPQCDLPAGRMYRVPQERN